MIIHYEIVKLYVLVKFFYLNFFYINFNYEIIFILSFHAFLFNCFFFLFRLCDNNILNLILPGYIFCNANR